MYAMKRTVLHIRSFKVIFNYKLCYKTAASEMPFLLKRNCHANSIVSRNTSTLGIDLKVIFIIIVE
jgi:hypothetical protein